MISLHVDRGARMSIAERGLRQTRVAIVSLDPPDSVGGLAAYARTLGHQVLSGGAACIYISLARGGGTSKRISSNSELPILQVQSSLHWDCFCAPLFSRLASRSFLHGLLERLVCAALPPKAILRAAGPLDVVHFIGTGWNYAGFAFLRAARHLGVVFTVWPAVHPGNWGDDIVDVRLYRQADGVFCQSLFEQRHLASRGVPETKLLRCSPAPDIPTIADGDGFRRRYELSLRPAVLFLGRRDNGKGYPALLRAWKTVLERVPNAVLLLAGPGGEKRSALLDAIPASSIRDLNVPDHNEKADAIAACDVFCLPSAHESFGIVYVEAWSYGKPVVCGTAPASRELIKDGETGLWSDGTSESIARQLITLLGSPGLRTALGEAGRSLQLLRYTASAMANAHFDAWGDAFNVNLSTQSAESKR